MTGENVGMGYTNDGKLPNEMECCKLVKDSDMGFVGATYNPHNQHCSGVVEYGFKENDHPKSWIFRTTLWNPDAMKRKIFETIIIFYLMSTYSHRLSLIEHNSYFVSSIQKRP